KQFACYVFYRRVLVGEESQNAIEEVPQLLLADEGCDMDIDDVGIDFA
ncbi:hypothetical protein F441_12661, partial [Phytophthora nicotianae CJ01A1]